ncbi:glycosyltransferase family 4 protein [Salinicoccus carnicancri]|uniref:glycosyltransferase family 4 protein n=1 Tax=Salinicoccus carnicancri TaxID=558170 RepID=UPI00031F90F8|nr:glycosyltransferase family 4 protein [Salinicoccus carnicancri]
MHMLLVHQFFLNQNGSGGSRFNQFVKYWEEQGHTITVLAGTVNYTTGMKDSKYKGKFITEERISPSVKVLRCHVSEGYNKNFIGRLFGYFSFNLSSTFALFKVKKADVIVVTSPPLFVGITGIIAKTLKRKPLIFEVRDLWPESAIDTGILTSRPIIQLAYLIEKFSYKAADRINVLTPAFKNKLVVDKEVSEDKIIYIPNGADSDIFIPKEDVGWVREKYQLKDKFIITYMGAHGLANNLISLLKAAKKIKNIDQDVHFMLIGDGMKKKELVEYANQHGLDNVTFIDAQPKESMPDFCNTSNLCTAILQDNDTFKTVYPNKVFDYMSCKKPILLGIDGIARDLVEKNDAGIYVSPNNTDEMVDTILSLKGNRKRLNEMGINGYNFVVENFERKTLAKKYISHMEELVNDKKNV